MPVRLRCQISLEARVADGMVSDVSFGGLSVQTPLAAEQGDTVHVCLEPAGSAPIEIEALVWNVRSGRTRRTGVARYRLGLVLSEAPMEFEGLVRGRSAGRKAPAAKGPPKRLAPAQGERGRSEPAPEHPEPAAASVPEEAQRRYRAQVRQPGTSRTRGILVFASTPESAGVRAMIEAGEDWSLLEVAEA